MKRRRLFWHLYPYLFAIIIISLILVTIYTTREMRNIQVREIRQTLENRARILEVQLKGLISVRDTIKIDSLCKQYGRLTDTRITVVDINGNVLGDSEKDPQLMENHSARPEIVTAFNGVTGSATRFSNTLQKNMKYVALPVSINGNIEGVIRTSLPVSDIEETLSEFYQNVALGGILIILIAAFVSFIVFKRFTNPLCELQKGAEKFANGQLDYKLHPSNIEEIASLTESMNRMAEELNSRIRMIVDQRNEREAILTSMTEGILALDSKQNIVSFNKAAVAFFDLNSRDVLGKSIYETLRISDLHRLVDETSKSDAALERELRLPGENDKYFQAHGTPLTDILGNRIGMVLVLTDITRLKRLENIRRDFVANVSHELKTPITTILGSAETILDGAIEIPDDRDRFLKMIAKNSNRLNSLVDDLLTLARVESEFEDDKLDLLPGKINAVLNSSILACQGKADSQYIDISFHCDTEIETKINTRQLEQAVINLIDNAIKYSETDSQISIKADIIGDEIVISVEDQGCGIESKHLPRLFERFYRVDMARSREVGGTGLGLSIVKHIALAHRGEVSVDSIPNKGSTFRIHLPLSN